MFKIRGGNTSIFDENVVRDAIKSKEVLAPIVVDDQFKRNFEEVLTLSPAECRF